MGIGEVEALFPSGEAPEQLRRLADWQSSRKYVETGSFDLQADQSSVTAWFDGDEAPAADFLAFAKNADGGIYAFWLYEERRWADAPIVYLDSEGVGNGVVAENVRELLSLVATGTEPTYWLRGESDPAPLDVSAFHAWLRDAFGIEPAADPIAVVRRAQSRHPDLEAFIETWVADRRS